jgi:hypothetical protein
MSLFQIFLIIKLIFKSSIYQRNYSKFVLNVCMLKADLDINIEKQIIST